MTTSRPCLPVRGFGPVDEACETLGRWFPQVSPQGIEQLSQRTLSGHR